MRTRLDTKKSNEIKWWGMKKKTSRSIKIKKSKSKSKEWEINSKQMHSGGYN